MKKIIERIEELIKQSEKIQLLGDKNDISRKYLQKRTWLLHSCEDVLKYATLDKYLEEFRKLTNNVSYVCVYEIAEITGLLESARDSLQHGFVGNIRSLLHAEMFDSIVEQADGLLASRHKIPAAVLGRIVIERWLRDQAEKVGISNWDTDKATVLNDNLKRAEIFSVPKWQLIQSLLDIGNSAAHGGDSEFSVDDVRRMLDFTKANCV